jgi:nucleoside-diphosphate-sugar epimerase
MTGGIPDDGDDAMKGAGEASGEVPGEGPGEGTRSPAMQPNKSLRHRPSAPRKRRTAHALVVGASGFIGGHLTQRLVEQGYRVRALVRASSDQSALPASVDIETGCLEDRESLRRATAGITHIYNCSGMSTDWGPWDDFQRVNVLGNRNLVEAAQHAGTVKRLLHVSTTDVYGYPVRPCDETEPPRDVGLPYNRSKLFGEQVVQQTAESNGVPYTIVRPATVYGPRSKDIVATLAELLLTKRMVYIGNGEVPAGLLYVENAVDAMIAACAAETAAGKTYNLRDPEPTTWKEYIEALADGIGAKPPSVNLPSPVALGLATAAEKLYTALRVRSRPPLTRHLVYLLARDQSYGIDRARRDFDFRSEVAFDEGMRRTLRWLNSAEGRSHLPGS